MIENPMSPNDEQLLLNALVTYGDACAQPGLTPSCPYYRKDSAGVPYCEEQCRTLLDDFGVRSRPVRHVQIGGLVMSGRQLPLTAAGGVAAFDAQQLYLTDRQKLPANQSTSSLLMGLRATMTQLPLEEGSALKQRAKATWLELARRGVPVAGIVRAGVLPGVTAEIASFSLLPAMLDAGLLVRAASDEYLQRLRALSDQTWGYVLAQAVDSEDSPESARGIAMRTFRPDFLKYHFGASQLLPGFGTDESVRPEAISAAMASDVRFTYAISGRFLNRVQDWLGRILADDFEEVIAWATPPIPVFTALSARDISPDPVELWLWERYTVTNEEDWSESSLMLEWQVHNGIKERPLPQTIWAERKTDEGVIANLALLKSSSKHDRIARRANGLRADDFVNVAVRHLRVGEVQKAADLYFGLAELRPSDPGVLNNLGFCLVPLDLELALKYLQRASIFPVEDPVTNAANRVLVLHLLERDAEATRLADLILSSEQGDDGPGEAVVLWEHSHGGGFRLLEHAYARQYIERLREHMQERSLKEV
jgi:hypothetical protein